MSLYRVVKPVAFTKEDGSSAQVAMRGAVVNIDDDYAAELGGRVELLDNVEEDLSEAEPVTLVDPPESDGKPGENSTNADLVDFLVKSGVKRSTVANLNKADLLDAVERLTHTSDDD